MAPFCNKAICNDSMKHSIKHDFSRLFFIFLISLCCICPGQADIFIYQNQWGQMLFSDRALYEPGYKLIRQQASSVKSTRKPKANTQKNKFTRFDHDIDFAARSYSLDPALIKAVIHAESAFNPNATSHAGAQGLMQLMPATAASYLVTDPYNPRQNIMAGSKHLKYLLNKYKDDIDLALAAYNAGETPVRKYKGIPPYRETRNYVRKVKKLHTNYQSSY